MFAINGLGDSASTNLTKYHSIQANSHYILPKLSGSDQN